MPLLFLDLDDTLLDREQAFRDWSRAFLNRLGAPDADLEWLISVDADGITSPWDVAEAVQERYRLRVSSIDLVDALREGPVDYMRLDPLVACAIMIAADAGWEPVVICNGETRLQEAKIRRTGLDRYLADWVISEEVGVSKPNPRIFAIAAQRARMRLAGSWVIGDSPETDIGGAAAVGLDSVWLRRGRLWTEPRYEPTRVADGAIAALAEVLHSARL